MITPAGHRVLVKPDPVEEVSKGGIVIATKANEQQLKNATTIGTVVAIGMNAWKAFDDGSPWAKVGDRVSYAKYGGKSIKDASGEEFVVLNDEDILAILE